MATGTYHVNGKGETGKCSATQGKCPFGGDDQHYTSPEAAQGAYEKRMSGATVPTSATRNPPLREDQVKAAVETGVLTAEAGSRVGSTLYTTGPMALGRNQFGRRTFAEVRLTQYADGTWESDVRTAAIDKGERRMKVAAPQLESINPDAYQFKGGKLSGDDLRTLRGLGGWGPDASPQNEEPSEEAVQKLLKLSAKAKS